MTADITIIDNVENKLKNPGRINEELLRCFTAFLDIAPKSVATYQRAIRQLLSYIVGHGISNPQPEDYILFKKELEAKGKHPATIQSYLAAARRFFQWTEQMKIYPNITSHVKGVKLDKGFKKDYLTPQQIKAILSSVDRGNIEGLRNYAVLALMTTGGLRTVEIIRANIEDIRKLSGVSVLYIQGKGHTDKEDFVKLDPNVEMAIRDYLKERDNLADDAPLFVSESRRNKGGRLTTRTISGICKKAMRTAGYDSERLTAHSLRHTAVTLALLGGESIEDVQRFARHQNISTTQIYAHNLDRMKSHCESTIAAAIF